MHPFASWLLIGVRGFLLHFHSNWKLPSVGVCEHRAIMAVAHSSNSKFIAIGMDEDALPPFWAVWTTADHPRPIDLASSVIAEARWNVSLFISSRSGDSALRSRSILCQSVLLVGSGPLLDAVSVDLCSNGSSWQRKGSSVNTPAHLIFGMAAFGRPGQRNVTTAAVAGAFAPDASLYAMVGVSVFVLGIPVDTVFRELYYSDAWQRVFAVDNSFVFWGMPLMVALWRRWQALFAFTGSGLLHLAFDFPLHGHDARMHFWPISNWVFESPLSYWDSSSWAHVVGPIELGVSMVLCGFLLVRFNSWITRLGIVVLALAQLSTSGIWHFVF